MEPALNLHRIENFQGGWLLGDFDPTILRNKSVEVGVKFFKKGDLEASHKQLVATEITVLNSGSIRIEQLVLTPGDVLVIEPGEYADFEALEDGSLTCIKFPSIPSDKVLK